MRPTPTTHRWSVRLHCLVVQLSTCVLVAAGVAHGPRLLGDEGSSATDSVTLRKLIGTSTGLIVVVGAHDPDVVLNLGQRDATLIQIAATDRKQVAELRRQLSGRQRYGTISARWFDGRHLPYADRLVSVLILTEKIESLPVEECLRVLSPGGRLVQRKSSKWWIDRKPWPPTIDQWTHFLHGPDGNAVAHDTVADSPRSLQWIDGPRFLRHHNMTTSFSAMVSADGRLFSILDDSVPGITGLPDQWSLVARDAFNGILLWRRPLPDWGWKAWTAGQNVTSHSRFDAPQDVPRRLVAVGDRVFVAAGEAEPVQMLDAATGRQLRTFAGTEHASELLFVDGRLLVASRHPSGSTTGQPGTTGRPNRRGKPADAVALRLAMFDVDTGVPVWTVDNLVGTAPKIGPLHTFADLYLAAAAGRVFLVNGDQITALSLADGSLLWSAPRPPRKEIEARYSSLVMSNLCTLVADRDRVYFCQLKALSRNPWYEPTPTQLIALSAADGRPLWDYSGGSWNCYSPADVFLIDSLVWVQTAKPPYQLVGLDSATGQIKRRIDITDAVVQEHHHRCYRNKATDRFVLHGRRGIEMLDLQGRGNDLNHWTRGACRYGVLPGNGLIYAPPDPCICYITAKLAGMAALAPARQFTPAANPADRLVTGPAFGKIDRVSGQEAPPESVWPTFRGDAGRTGSSRSELPSQLVPRWLWQHPGRLTPPTISTDHVYVAAIDEHTVFALDRRHGRPVWSYTAGGRVDSPPTIYGPLLLFGSADGAIQALRRADGQLVWRYRAAPDDRQIVSFGQLESAWPVHGSILVDQGEVFAAAGRTSFLDHGIVVCRLDPLTGKLLQQHRLDSIKAAEQQPSYDARLRYDMPPDRPGSLTDILVLEGDSIYMRHTRLDPSDLTRDFDALKSDAERDDVYRHQIPRIHRPGPQVAASVGLLEENWYNQLYWSYAGESHCRLLVVDRQRTYGVRAYTGKPARHARSIFQRGKSKYTLFADDRSTKVSRVWSKPIEQRVSALLIAGNVLVVGGADTVATADDPWSAIEYRGPGSLATFAPDSGQPLARYQLPAAPVWNGLAAADQQLVAALRDGSVHCWGAERQP